MRQKRRRHSNLKQQLPWIIAIAIVIVAAVFFILHYGDWMMRLVGGNTSYSHYTLDGASPEQWQATQYTENFTIEHLEASINQSYILIGDSRTKGMNQATGASQSSQITVFAEVSMGYSWMVEEALPAAAGISCYNYVILLGVTDLTNIDRYPEKYRELISMGVSLTLVTIGPVEEGKGGYSIKNSQIEDFNARLYEVEGAKVLDLYTYMQQNGFSTLDGVHYTDETYYMILRFLLERLD